MQLIHLVVLFANASCLVRIAGQQHFLRTVRQFDRNPAYFGEAALDFRGQHVIWMSPSGDLGDMHGQCAHPIHIGDDLYTAHDTAQFARHWLLKCQQCNGTLLGTYAQRLADVGFGVVVVGVDVFLNGGDEVGHEWMTPRRNALSVSSRRNRVRRG